jgi:antitoxin HicB
MKTNYSMIIQWSKKDRCFVVTLPEWGELCHTYGDTYEEALNNAKEVLRLMIESSLQEESSLPAANLFTKTLPPSSLQALN